MNKYREISVSVGTGDIVLQLRDTWGVPVPSFSHLASSQLDFRWGESHWRTLGFHWSSDPSGMLAQTPIWPIVLLFSTIPFTWINRRLTRTHRRSQMQTGFVCRYNLTGDTSGVCPECGTPTASRQAADGTAKPKIST
jgi:hypothetical protein